MKRGFTVSRIAMTVGLTCVLLCSGCVGLEDALDADTETENTAGDTSSGTTLDTSSDGVPVSASEVDSASDTVSAASQDTTSEFDRNENTDPNTEGDTGEGSGKDTETNDTNGGTASGNDSSPVEKDTLTDTETQYGSSDTETIIQTPDSSTYGFSNDSEGTIDTFDIIDSDTAIIGCLFVSFPKEVTATPQAFKIFYHTDTSLASSVAIDEDVISDISIIPSEVTFIPPSLEPGRYYMTIVVFVEGGGTDLPVAGVDLSYTVEAMNFPWVYDAEYGGLDIAVPLTLHRKTSSP